MAVAASFRPEIPLEVQLEIFSHLHAISPASFTSTLGLSRAHHRLLRPLLYRSICARSRLTLEGLASTLLCQPELARHVRSFFFQGPQGRRKTGRDQLRLLVDAEEGEEEEEEGDPDVPSSSSTTPADEMTRAGLEAGIEGEGQEATWDEHESLMHLCTLILRLCSDHLESIGFVDCVPWFLAPSEGGALNFPLPRCKDFTGVTVGLFGLLPHIQRNGKGGEPDSESGRWTALQRIHLIGGDFGSYALQRVLLSSHSSTTLTHLHITAPTLYRPEHHSHLVMHIVELLNNIPNLKRISVGFLHWFPTPPSKKAAPLRSVDGNTRTMASMDAQEQQQTGTGDDSFERGQLRERPVVAGFGPTEYDDRLSQCRDAYFCALPEALQKSKREDATVAIMRLAFAEGTPVGFAGWILSHYSLDGAGERERRDSKELGHFWNKRDLTALPEGVAEDGAPKESIWDVNPTMEWSLQGGQLQMTKGEKDSE